MSNKPIMAVYGDYTHIIIGGNARTPKRFWSVGLYTQVEYDQLTSDQKEKVRHINSWDIGLCEMHFPHIPH